MAERSDDILREVVEIALSQNNLKRLTEALSRLLKNPLAVYDTSYYILAHSSIQHINDPVWLAGMKRGYCRYEYAAQLSKLTTTGDRFQIISGVGPVRRRMALLQINGAPVGYYSVLESETPFEQVAQEDYELAGKLLAKEVSFLCAPGYTQDSISYHGLLTDLLNGNFVNRQLFHQRLAGSELDISTTFRLINIDMSTYAAPVGKEQMRDALKQLLPASWSVYHTHNIVILLNAQASHYGLEDPFCAFREYLEVNQLRCCISDAFEDLYHLKDHYALTSYALQAAKTRGDKRVFLEYEGYKLQRIVDLIPTDEVPFLCSTPVWEIYKADYLNKTNYLQTLFWYLHYGRSLRDTAEALFIHRNTVAYRIQKISEKFGISFQQEHQNIHSYISCLLLISSDTLNNSAG